MLYIGSIKILEIYTSHTSFRKLRWDGHPCLRFRFALSPAWFSCHKILPTESSGFSTPRCSWFCRVLTRHLCQRTDSVLSSTTCGRINDKSTHTLPHTFWLPDQTCPEAPNIPSDTPLIRQTLNTSWEPTFLTMARYNKFISHSSNWIWVSTNFCVLCREATIAV